MPKMNLDPKINAPGNPNPAKPAPKPQAKKPAPGQGKDGFNKFFRKIGRGK